MPNKAKEIDAIAGTMSVGVATYGTESPSALSFKELIERADQAMFHSKNSGRNKVTPYDPDVISPQDKKMAAEIETPIDTA
jgi:PleD family two-component response regulator